MLKSGYPTDHLKKERINSKAVYPPEKQVVYQQWFGSNEA